MSNGLLFYVNGRRFAIDNPDPTTLLIDWLRADEMGLTGTKLSCGEGGCGACTVMLSRWDVQRKRVSEMAINACLRPLCSLDGVMITTTEGIGSTREKLDRVQYRIAANKGSQCGYCTPGFVMNMFTYLRTHPKPLQQEIEDLFDGHICRCTGYRPILEGMKSFAVDFKKHDTYHTNHPCFADVPIEQHEPGPRPQIEMPPELIEYAKHPASRVYGGRGYTWYRPVTLAEAQELKARHGGNSRNVKLVAGNTSIGIYKADVDDPHVLIDVAALPELLGFQDTAEGLTIGAAEPLQNVIDALQRAIDTKPEEKTRGFSAFRRHLLDVANLQVRNIGSIGGNLMMTRAQAETASPFPSDVYLVLTTLGATITIASRDFDGGRRTWPMLELPAPRDLPADAIAESIHLPYTKAGDRVETFKIAYRDQNAHAIVNAGFLVTLDKKGTVHAATIAYGGLAPMPSRMPRTEAALQGKKWDDATLQLALNVLAEEVASVIRPMPGARFLPAGYRESLTETLFYKFFLGIRPAVRPLSGGTQTISVYGGEAPTGEPILKTTAFIQASGEQKYTQDLPLPPHGYDSAFAISGIAAGTYRFKHRDGAKGVEKLAREKYPGVVAFVTADDIPQKDPQKRCVGLGADDPIFALDQTIICWGQPIGLVVADDRWTAQRAAHYIETELIDYSPRTPVVTIEEALALPDGEGLFQDQPDIGDVHIHGITRKGSDETWLRDPAQPMRGCQVASGMMHNEAQAHFYMETQGALALPEAQGTLTMYSGTQQGSSVQSAIAQLLDIGNSSVIVYQRPLGGGFGGKQFRPAVIDTAAAIAAWVLDRRVRLILDRNTDMNVTGKRHPFTGRFHATFTRKGEIQGYKVSLVSNGGSTHDASFPIMDLAQQHADGSYFVPTWQSDGNVAKTNNASNTAFRSFGVVQTTLIVEEAIERIAHACGMRAEDVRWKNMYRKGERTPYAQKLDPCDIRELWKKLMKSSDFDKRRKDVDRYNAKNRWRKRGLTMIPLKYGVGYQPRLLDQGVALVMAYASDGTVLVQHGGAESGQGIDTKMQQIAASTLGIPMDIIRVGQTSTSVMPNATATAASSGSDLFGGAVRKACQELRGRLENYCRENKVKNWKKEWQTLWPTIVSGAYAARVNLVSEALYRTPFIGDVEGDHPYGRAFLYFVFATAASEVEIDVLTGETTLLRSDILIDIGHSLNPCLDVGQVEGAFVQGCGLMTTEQMMYEPDGRLYSNGTWEYKPPCSKSIPVDLRVTIAHGGRPTPEDAAVMSSRGIGEPPLVLSTSVFFAIKQAIMAARRDRGDNTWFEMPAPATVGRVQSHCLVTRSALRM